MSFSDANAARQGLGNSCIIGEEQFQAAVMYQRAICFKSSLRGEDRLTIYKSQPIIDGVIRFDEDDFHWETG